MRSEFSLNIWQNKARRTCLIFFFFFRESLWETISNDFFSDAQIFNDKIKETSTWPVKSRHSFSYFFINWNKLLDYKLALLYEISFQFVFKQAKHMHLKWHSRSGVTVVERCEWYWTNMVDPYDGNHVVIRYFIISVILQFSDINGFSFLLNYTKLIRVDLELIIRSIMGRKPPDKQKWLVDDFLPFRIKKILNNRIK